MMMALEKRVRKKKAVQPGMVGEEELSEYLKAFDDFSGEKVFGDKQSHNHVFRAGEASPEEGSRKRKNEAESDGRTPKRRQALPSFNDQLRAAPDRPDRDAVSRDMQSSFVRFLKADCEFMVQDGEPVTKRVDELFRKYPAVKATMIAYYNICPSMVTAFSLEAFKHQVNISLSGHDLKYETVFNSFSKVNQDQLKKNFMLYDGYQQVLKLKRILQYPDVIALIQQHEQQAAIAARSQLESDTVALVLQQAQQSAVAARSQPVVGQEVNLFSSSRLEEEAGAAPPSYDSVFWRRKLESIWGEKDPIIDKIFRCG
jgi:hypothetical protein